MLSLVPFIAQQNSVNGVVLFELWFAKTSAGTKNRAVLGRVGLNTIIARYGMKTKTLKGTTLSARGAHIYKGSAESRSGLGGSIVTMVQPADSLLGKNPT